MIAVVLFLLPWVVLLLMHGQHIDAGTVVAVISVVAAASVSLPALWLTWAGYRRSVRADAEGGLSLGQVADRLAIAVRTQWEAEARVHRLDDPWPLPVSWGPADASLTSSWDSLVRLASSGAGWPGLPHARAWAAGPEGLAGDGGDLVNALARVPTGRLVVLGEPGAGKTVLMVRLVLDLLDRRAEGDPVPFLSSIASWDPAEQDLRGWLATQLLIDHPALAASAGREEPARVAALLAAGLILPVLDGLDEIPEQSRARAISRINEALGPGERMVVTCRTQQYRDAVQPRNGPEVPFRGAAAVQLRQLDAGTVRAFLCDAAAGSAARARWEPVLADLGSTAPVGLALRTPLMVALARAIYSPRPGEHAGKLPDPSELCGLQDCRAVEASLLDEFIPTSYRSPGRSRWTAAQAEKWLVFLARHLDHTIGSHDFAWWQLQEHAPRTVLRTASGLLVGLALGPAFALAPGPAPGGVYGGLAAGLGAGILAGLVLGLVGSARDTGGFGTGVVFGAGDGIVFGLLAGVIAWLALSMRQTAWPSYVFTRGWLAFHHHLPLSLMSFLADAHKRGILRQAGAVYQFRHIQLQHRLATRDETA